LNRRKIFEMHEQWIMNPEGDIPVLIEQALFASTLTNVAWMLIAIAGITWAVKTWKHNYSQLSNDNDLFLVNFAALVIGTIVLLATTHSTLLILATPEYYILTRFGG
jgi:hypothetical protein